MAKNGDNKESRPRIDYAPEWITRSRDDVPPNDEPLSEPVTLLAVVNATRPEPSSPSAQVDSDSPGNDESSPPQPTEG